MWAGAMKRVANPGSLLKDRWGGDEDCLFDAVVGWAGGVGAFY